MFIAISIPQQPLPKSMVGSSYLFVVKPSVKDLEEIFILNSGVCFCTNFSFTVFYLAESSHFSFVLNSKTLPPPRTLLELLHWSYDVTVELWNFPPARATLGLTLRICPLLWITVLCYHLSVAWWELSYIVCTILQLIIAGGLARLHHSKKQRYLKNILRYFFQSPFLCKFNTMYLWYI